jgi:hypothetical protein
LDSPKRYCGIASAATLSLFSGLSNPLVNRFIEWRGNSSIPGALILRRVRRLRRQKRSIDPV